MISYFNGSLEFNIERKAGEDGRGAGESLNRMLKLNLNHNLFF